LNDKRFVKPLLEKLKRQCAAFKAVVADAQYDSARVRETVREYAAEAAIPYTKRSKIRKALTVGRDFIVQGVKRLVRLFQEACKRRKGFQQSKRMVAPRPPEG
jgi:hypothetical protein